MLKMPIWHYKVKKMMGFDVIGFIAPDGQCAVSPVQDKPVLNEDIGSLVKRIPDIKFFCCC